MRERWWKLINLKMRELFNLKMREFENLKMESELVFIGLKDL